MHAAWVWIKESGKTGKSVKLQDVAGPFVILDETRRKKPMPENRAAVRALKNAYIGLSERVRGVEGGDPFHLRLKMV